MQVCSVSRFQHSRASKIREPHRPLLVNAARTIDGAVVSKIELSERLTKILRYVDQADAALAAAAA
jgi:hypothetical protein